MQDIPIIDPAVIRLAPDFRVLHLFVSTPDAPAIANPSPALVEACQFVRDGGPPWADAHLAAWADTYAQFGAKPNRTPCSAQALRKRVLKDGVLPSINPVVDLYNAISLRYAVPVGGENRSCPGWWCSSAVVKLTGRALSPSAVAAGQLHGWPSKIFG